MTDEDRLEILGHAVDAGLAFGGGACGEVAIAINDVLFDGKGTLVAVANKALLDQGRFVGHVGVRDKRGVVWDSEGTYDNADALEEFKAWGMVDARDHDLTDEEAHEVVMFDTMPNAVRRLLPKCSRTKYRELLRQAAASNRQESQAHEGKMLTRLDRVLSLLNLPS